MSACSGGGELVIEQAEPAPEATAVVAEPTEVPTEVPAEAPTEVPTEAPTTVAIVDGDYGSDPDLDVLYDVCGAGGASSAEACDELYARSPIDSEYETYAATCGGIFDSPVANCALDEGGDSPPPKADGNYYGSDPDLDVAFDSCAAGNGQACDDLFLAAPIDSFYEAYGADCGGRYPGTDLFCAEIFDGTADSDVIPAVDSYGSDIGMDVLWDQCGSGSAEACDNLWQESPVDSAYETYGYTCGLRDFNDAFCSDILF